MLLDHSPIRIRANDRWSPNCSMGRRWRLFSMWCARVAQWVLFVRATWNALFITVIYDFDSIETVVDQPWYLLGMMNRGRHYLYGVSRAFYFYTTSWGRGAFSVRIWPVQCHAVARTWISQCFIILRRVWNKFIVPERAEGLTASGGNRSKNLGSGAHDSRPFFWLRFVAIWKVEKLLGHSRSNL